MAPQSLHLEAAGLRIEWGPPAGSATLSAAVLRRACRCAECQRPVRLGEAPPAPQEGLRVVDASTVGAYGVRLHFSDGHARGIYPWAYLGELVAPTATRSAGAQTNSTYR